MNRLLLRYSNAPLLLLMTLLALSIQTSLFYDYPFNYLQPDVVLLAVIWVALKRPFVEGGLLTLVLSEFAEIHSSAPRGVFLLVYMAIFLFTRGLSRIAMLQDRVQLVFYTVFASALWKLALLLVVHLMGESENLWRHSLSLLLPGAVVEGLISVWAYRLLARFDWVTFKDPRARDASSEDLLLEEESL